MPKVAPAVLMFAPERWGQVTRFRKLSPSTYQFSERDQRAIEGVEAHFTKCCRLTNLATRLAPNLQNDNDELEEHGVTPAINAAELATVIEAAILELYSAIDCMTKVLRAVYGQKTRGFKDSTRGLFQKANTFHGLFPDELKVVVAEASWFPELLHLRDELTHLATGHVSLNRETKLVQYIHMGMKQSERVLVIDDIFSWLHEMIKNVNMLLAVVFQKLNETLVDKEVFQLCGMVSGRVLHRYVSPAATTDFNSGSCGAWVWFELPDHPTCPFKDACGAYTRKWQPASA